MDVNQSQCDSPLTQLGIEQAKYAKKWFGDYNIIFDQVYCSTTERAMDLSNEITGQTLNIDGGAIFK